MMTGRTYMISMVAGLAPPPRQVRADPTASAYSGNPEEGTGSP